MKKTCYNCVHYCDTLCAPNDPTYHIHNWCKYNNRIIDAYAIADTYEYNSPYNDDLETGDASCNNFLPKNVPMFDDTWFEKNRQENIKNRISPRK